MPESKNMHPRTCRECGIIFIGGPRAWYCPKCREIRRATTNAEYRQRKKEGKVREIGSTDKCLNCGEKYIVNAGLQKYCEKCAPEMMKELDRAQGMNYYNANKDKINPVRMVARRKKKYCKKCAVPIPAAGGREYCDDCISDGRWKLYGDQVVERNIHKLGRSYAAYVCYKGKSIYIKATLDREKAVKIRDFAEKKIKQGEFERWIKDFKNNGRNIDDIV